VLTTSCDEGDNGNNVGDSNEELVAVAEHDFKCKARQSTDHIKKLLEATCPDHTYLIRHKLSECTMMKNYMTTGTFARGKKAEDDSTRKAVTPFPEEKVVMSIYSGPVPHKS
jgi:hypothetical protein